MSARDPHPGGLEAKLLLGKYRWRAACLSLIPLLIHQCGESYGIGWMSWLGFYLLSLCVGVCIRLSMEMAGV